MMKSINSKFIIHFIGIGGIGMSGIAELMYDLGYKVQGSDIGTNENVIRSHANSLSSINEQLGLKWDTL